MQTGGVIYQSGYMCLPLMLSKNDTASAFSYGSAFGIVLIFDLELTLGLALAMVF